MKNTILNSILILSGSESSAAAVASDPHGPQDGLDDLSLSHDGVSGKNFISAISFSFLNYDCTEKPLMKISIK